MEQDRLTELRRVVAEFRRDKYGTSTCLACNKTLYGPELLHYPPRHWMETMYSKADSSARGGNR